MAYGNFFPATYQPMYYTQQNPYYQQMQNQGMVQQNQQNQQTQQTQQNQQIQQSGFVLVPSEQVARNYPVAPGNSITFKDENAPYCYVKTMGFNQLDRPTFERYRLVKEDDPVVQENAPDEGREDKSAYALKSDLSAIWDEVDALKEKLKAKTETEKGEDDE